jgi:hypothetical protein
MGAGGTLEYLLRAYAGSHRDVGPTGPVIPVAVSPVRPSPPLQHHTGRCGDIPTLLGRAGTRHRHNGHCAMYGLPVKRHPRTGPPRRPVNQLLRRSPRSRSCTSTGRTTPPQQERDSPGRPSAPQHCSPYRYTYRNSTARMLTAPSLAYKRRGSPPAAGDRHGTTDSSHSHALRPPHDIGTRLNQTSGTWCDNPPRKIPYYRLRPIQFGH